MKFEICLLVGSSCKPWVSWSEHRRFCNVQTWELQALLEDATVFFRYNFSISLAHPIPLVRRLGEMLDLFDFDSGGKAPRLVAG